jgi:hypothetical protein
LAIKVKPVVSNSEMPTSPEKSTVLPDLIVIAVVLEFPAKKQLLQPAALVSFPVVSNS